MEWSRLTVRGNDDEGEGTGLLAFVRDVLSSRNEGKKPEQRDVTGESPVTKEVFVTWGTFPRWKVTEEGFAG